MSEKEITEQAEKMWLEYHGDYPPDDVPWMPPVYIRGFKDALRWVRGAEHVIPAEEAEDLRDALDLALSGPGPEIVCEVVGKVRL